jgi:hypothetical protein
MVMQCGRTRDAPDAGLQSSQPLTQASCGHAHPQSSTATAKNMLCKYVSMYQMACCQTVQTCLFAPGVLVVLPEPILRMGLS